ncbi:MAG TPA: tetratricopeptide repeat protein, partial [Beijerinckiaceae bacterium]|nr:tetratricopeptide repeat protein [Beijerinckiaceae bacterium]
PATAPARPADVAELMKASPYKGPERLRQAAVNGNLAAIYEIGARYADGRGTARDLKLASRWLEFAAEQGFAPAQYRFGSFNREGLGMQQDAKVAFQWFMKAAEQGHILAMHNLAVLYAEGVNGSPDYASAAAWFRNAAEHGVKDSQFNIAILHVRGLGVVQDMVEAYKWFAIAAQKGDADAIKRRDEVAARLSPNQLEDAKNRVEEFRPRRPDMRANDVGAPEGGWDQAPRAPGAPQQKKSRV